LLTHTHASTHERAHADLSESFPADDAAVFRFDDAISLRDVGGMPRDTRRACGVACGVARDAAGNVSSGLCHPAVSGGPRSKSLSFIGPTCVSV
jgi:hypothetical protein